MSEETTSGTESTETKPAPTPREVLVAKYNALSDKRKELDAKMGEIVAQVHALDNLASIAEGSTVIITVGKKDAKSEVPGKVLAVRVNEDGTKDLKVAYGSGFDADIIVVPASKVKLPVPETQPAE